MVTFQEIEKSYEITWAGMLAIKLALDHKSQAIQFEEYFGALYLASREALLPYWSNNRELDRFVRDVCGLMEPAWFYWIGFYDALKTKEIEGILVPYSDELGSILNNAAELALKTAKGSVRKPQLAVEHFMVALAAHPDLKFSSRMLESGMKLRKVSEGVPSRKRGR